jgi:hypothetical protein
VFIMIHTVGFATGFHDELDRAVVVPTVDGVLLTDLIDRFEAATGMQPSGDHYGGLVPAAHAPFGEHLLGRPAGSRVPLLGCSCGDWGCWPLLAGIFASEETLVWKDFEQPHRPSRDYAGFGPFRFDRVQYESAVQDLLARL